jgi:hypothetical protein
VSRPRTGLIIAILIIAVGAIALLSNLNVLNPQALASLSLLWPLILIVAGLWIAFNRLLPSRTATIAGGVVLAGAIVFAVVFSSIGPVGGGRAQSNASAPLGGLTSATLDMGSGAVSADVSSDDLGDLLYRASFQYPSADRPPSATVDRSSGTLRIRFGNTRSFPFVGGGRRHIDLTLNNRVTWAAAIEGGANDLTIDLSDGQLGSLQVSGGVSHVDATLGAPQGTVNLTIDGGASSIDLQLPDGTAWHAQVNGGPSTLEVNGSSSGGLGNLERQSDGYASAQDRYDVTVNGGASKLTIDTGG